MNAIGITSLGFWAVLVLGIVCVAPLTRATWRWGAIAGLNVGFLAWIQHGWVILSCVFLLCSYVAVRLVAGGGRRRSVAFGLGVLGTLALLVMNKTPALDTRLPAPAVMWLSGLGFSYVALRLIDELATVRDSGEAPTLIEHVNYLVPFHMLAAGPIQRFAEFRSQPVVVEALTFDEAFAAIERIALGLFKKLVLAHLIDRLCLTGFRSTGAYYFLEVQLFLTWLYLDFSSYSDIAIGVGRLIGVRTPENFDRPYLARNMVEFWERWHISLSQWIRRNVFLPLQVFLQRRYPTLPQLTSSSFSLLVAFALCGVWHTISWRYAAWGIMHAFGVIAANFARVWRTRRLGRAGYVEYMKRRGPRLVGVVLTFEFVAWSLALIGAR